MKIKGHIFLSPILGLSGKQGKRGKREKGGKPVILNYYNNYHILQDSEGNGASQKVYRIGLLFTLEPGRERHSHIKPYMTCRF